MKHNFKVMKIYIKLIIILIFSASSFTVIGQARPAMCRIYPLWKDEKVRGSYSGDIDTFKLDGEEGKTIRSFRYETFEDEEELIITAGIDFVFDYSSKPQSPYEIRLAITASNKEEKKVFEVPGSSEAKTLYKKNWNLKVTKNVKIKDITYMFTISCSDGMKLPGR